MMQPKNNSSDCSRLTRKQLKAYGLSDYHATILTEKLEPIGKNANAYVYSCRDIIASAYDYVKKRNIKAKTCESINKIVIILHELLGNTIELSFENSSDKDIQKLGAKLIDAMSKTDKSLARLKADRLEILHKYKEEIQ